MDNLDLVEESTEFEPAGSSDDLHKSEDDEFYFESDHLALRGNSDYRTVLRTIVILEAQKIEASKHIDQIAEAHRSALNDPETIVRKIAAGESVNLPGPINIQNLPKIKFEKYNVAMTPDENHVTQPTVNIKDENDLIVRGRIFDQSKPETFNQLWTCEEQRRLEELLIEYPPEPVEMRRFTKIAKALGNRTAKQVASRLQKYFQKLHAAGLPVPGRVPRNAKAYATNRKSRMVKHMIRPTTFFPSNYVPVNITDDDENNVHTLDPNYYRIGCSSNEFNADFETDGMVIVSEPNETDHPNAGPDDHIKMIQLVRRVKKDKEREYPIETANSEHIGYKCDYCSEEPIIGTRWHCITCKEWSIDFCSDCLIAQAQNDIHHSLDHTIYGYRISSDYRYQSDADSDNGDDAEADADMNDKSCHDDRSDDDDCSDDSLADYDELKSQREQMNK